MPALMLRISQSAYKELTRRARDRGSNARDEAQLLIENAMSIDEEPFRAVAPPAGDVGAAEPEPAKKPARAKPKGK